MTDARELIDHVFRQSAGRMVSSLTRILGPSRLDLAEDIAQEAMLRALRGWPYSGIPDNPEAWLMRVARNLALDLTRRDASLRDRLSEIERWASAGAPAEPLPPDELSDDQLRMMLTCCHPALSASDRVALTLKTVSGFSVAEIARAFLSRKDAVAQRLVRAKRKLRNDGVSFESPPAAEHSERLDSVLEVVYLMFNEGYVAHGGESLIRDDVIAEALRLTRALLANEASDRPKVHALHALMLLQGARGPARVDDGGRLLLIAEQDRNLWDRAMMAEGFHHLQLAMAGDELTPYHLEAGIASCHAAASSFEETEWERIRSFYDQLMTLAPSPVVALNRAVAVAFSEGSDRGLEELDKLPVEGGFADYALLFASRGELLRRLGRTEEAAEAFRSALERTKTEPERRFLRARIGECDSRD